jgi:hypothetical protein
VMLQHRVRSSLRSARRQPTSCARCWRKWASWRRWARGFKQLLELIETQAEKFVRLGALFPVRGELARQWRMALRNTSPQPHVLWSNPSGPPAWA